MYRFIVDIVVIPVITHYYHCYCYYYYYNLPTMCIDGVHYQWTTRHCIHPLQLFSEYPRQY